MRKYWYFIYTRMLRDVLSGSLLLGWVTWSVAASGQWQIWLHKNQSEEHKSDALHLAGISHPGLMPDHNLP